MRVIPGFIPGNGFSPYRIPNADGTSGQVLATGADGSTSWVTRLTQAAADSIYSPLGHTHDERYFTETESDARFAAIGHNHTGVYSPVGHAHAAADITSGTMATARLGSGTADNAVFLRGDSTWAAPSGADLSTAVLLAGRATPQTIAFGTGSGATAGYLTSTAHATKGKYLLNAAGTSAYDEANDRLGIGTPSPLTPLHLVAPNVDALAFTYDASNNYRCYIRPHFSGGSAVNCKLTFKVSDGTTSGTVDALALNGLGSVTVLGDITVGGSIIGAIANPAVFTAANVVAIRLQYDTISGYKTEFLPNFAGASAAGCWLKFNISDGAAGTVDALMLTGQRNAGLCGATDFGSGVGVIAIKDANTTPSVNPAGGGVLYCDAGALKFRGSSGTVTTLAAA